MIDKTLGHYKILEKIGSGENVPISLLDTKSGEYHGVLSSELLSNESDWIRPWPTISADDRTIYFERQRREADIWMLTLHTEQ